MSELTDDLARVREQMRQAASNPALIGDAEEMAADFISKHAAAIEAMERDARRYQWALDYGGEGDKPLDDIAWDRLTGPYVKEHIDAAIDAAMEAGHE